MKKLPEPKLQEAADFIEYLLTKSEDREFPEYDASIHSCQKTRASIYSHNPKHRIWRQYSLATI
ncbi:MAG: DUF2281 domain-containing protein [Bacteroidetes bacterium]|nr:DUF2281 domain-containing protein [Bacteroidota bacterium]